MPVTPSVPEEAGGGALHPLRHAPLYQQAHAQIRRAIADGQLQPGSRVDAQAIASELGISTTPVREALRQLVQEGLLETDGNRHLYVYSPTPESIAEIYAVRASLEAMAAAVVAQVGDPRSLHTLRSIHEQSVHALDEDDWRTVSRCNTRFHHELVELSQNRTALQLLDTLHAQIVKYRNLSMQFPDRRVTAVEEHGEILDLLEQGDPAVGPRLVRHLLDAGRFAMRTLRSGAETETPTMLYLRQPTTAAASDG